MARAPQTVTNVRQHSVQQIAEQIRARIVRGRGTMAVFIRPDGRVRILRDDLLEDDTGRGVVGHFTRRHDQAYIEAKLEAFLANNRTYLHL